MAPPRRCGMREFLKARRRRRRRRSTNEGGRGHNDERAAPKINYNLGMMGQRFVRRDTRARVYGLWRALLVDHQRNTAILWDTVFIAIFFLYG